MPWRLILFIISLILITFFIGFNLENACNVNFGFKQFDNVPIFLTVMFAFVAGILVTLPFTFGKRRQKTEKLAKTARRPKAIKAPQIPMDSKSALHNDNPKEKKDLKSFVATKKKDSLVVKTDSPNSTSDKESISISTSTSLDDVSIDTTPTDQAKN